MRNPTVFLVLLALAVGCCQGQYITVHVIEATTQQPIKDLDLVLKSGCMHSVRPKVMRQKTDSAGTAVFHGVSLAGLESCVVLNSAFYASLDLPYIFASAQ